MSFLDPAFVVTCLKYTLFNGKYFEYLQNAYHLYTTIPATYSGDVVIRPQVHTNNKSLRSLRAVGICTCM